MKNEITHLVIGLIWGVYSIVVGSLIILHGYVNIWSWVSIIVAVSGNSVHLISMDFGKSGLQIKPENPQK